MLIQMRKTKNDGLLKLIDTLPDNIIMAEIGCYAGESTELFLKSGKIKHIYAIDPWKGGYSTSDPAAFSPMDEVEHNFNMRTKGKAVTKLKMIMAEALDVLPDLDLVYIDGDHTYEAVKSDIELALTKLKPGAIIAGHDYRGSNPIVVNVQEFFGKPDHIFPDSSWIKIIK